MGYVVKLLAVAEQTDAGAVGVRVHPAMVPLEHPLAAVRESFNAVFVEGAAVGDLMFYGRGAGGSPTASAILGDLIDAAINRHKGSHASVGRLREAVLRPIDDAESAYYLNLEVLDRKGVLAQVAGVFGDNGVSIRSMEQEGLGDEARLIFITHRARHADVQATLAALGELEAVDRIGSVLRVLGDDLVRYISTRGNAPVLGFGDVLLTGLAADGGLYVPEEWPHLSSEVWSEVRPYDAVAVDVMWPFVEGSIGRDDFEAMVAAAYATFDHPDVCPLVESSTTSTCSSCSGARRWPSRTWRCSWWAGCSTTSCPPGASAPPSSWRRRATRARPPSKRAWAATPSTSSCSTPPVGSATCSAAR